MSRKIFDRAEIFPVQPGTKRPIRGTHGFHDATCKATIPPGYNIGCVPASVGLVCVDLDAGYDANWAEANLPPTLTVKSPHGYHLYYRSDEKFGNGHLGKHIDIRNAGGYTLLPPSRLADGSAYEWWDEREPVALPEGVRALLRVKQEHDNRPHDPDVDGGDDNSSNLTKARMMLQATDPSDNGYDIACRLRRDIGLSHAAAVEIFAEWSDTLPWPWDHDKIQSVCRNAGRYGRGAPGKFAGAGADAYAHAYEWHGAPDNSARAWLQRKLVPTVPLIGPINTTSRVMLVAPTGLGKTHVAMAWAVAVAAGFPWLHWSCSQGRTVLYIDGEMPRALLKERLVEALGRIGTPEAALDNLILVSTADYPDHTPLNLDSSWVNELIAKYDPAWIIYDNVHALTVGDQKDTEAWRTMLPWMRSLTDNGKAQLWVQHANETGGMYGDKTRAYQLDTVIELERADASADIVFNLKFTKHRELHPKRNKDVYRTGLVTLDNDRWRFIEEVQVQRSGMEAALEGEYGSGITTAELVKRLIDHGDLRSSANIKKWINRNRRRPEINRYTVPGITPVRWRLLPYGVQEIVPEVSQSVPKQAGTLGHPL